MDYELGIIKTMGFIEYILIVWDYINWCRTHDCWVGPGRGSAAGSRVCYCTGITDIDPVKYNLLLKDFLTQSEFPCLISTWILNTRRDIAP